MATTYLKRCTDTAAQDQPEVHALAARIISDIARRGEPAVEHYAREVDGVELVDTAACGAAQHSAADSAAA